MPGRKISARNKAIIIVSAVAAVITTLLFCRSMNASGTGSVVLTYTVCAQELDGTYSDRIDAMGYRHIRFETDVPGSVSNFAIVFDVDAPVGSNIRVIDDPETLLELGSPLKGKESGVRFAESEICFFECLEELPADDAYPCDRLHDWGGVRGGDFLSRGEAAHKNESHSVSWDENASGSATRTTYEIEYFVGKA